MSLLEVIGLVVVLSAVWTVVSFAVVAVVARIVGRRQ